MRVLDWLPNKQADPLQLLEWFDIFRSHFLFLAVVFPLPSHCQETLGSEEKRQSTFYSFDIETGTIFFFFGRGNRYDILLIICLLQSLKQIT